jgi:glycolate oxidase iron-sulfur subunit
VLDKLGISLTSAPSAGCCGALHYHLGEHTEGMDFMRRNIDAWWPLIEQGTEAIVITASGCGATIKDYGHILRNDPQYGEKAKEISRLAKDISEVLATENLDTLIVNPTEQRLALHCPCTLQHAQKLGGHLEQLLQRIGLKLTTSKDSHLCCGSAGSYSILQPEISARLRDKKVAALTNDQPDAIVTANVGCQLHLASSAAVPVKHWIEVVDDASSSQRSK